jgi:ABC-type bacteriocin/lantibiotic exporter with double-glycine peptidase domain
MRLRLPYFEQKFDYDCGAAALKMVLAAHGRRVPLAELIRRLRTTEKTGTTRRDMARVARTYGLRAETRCDSSLAELRRLAKRRATVIVEYILPDFEGAHYAAVAGFSPGYILLHDPTKGSHYKLTEKEFLKRWYGRHLTVHRRWRLVVSSDR